MRTDEFVDHREADAPATVSVVPRPRQKRSNTCSQLGGRDAPPGVPDLDDGQVVGRGDTHRDLTAAVA